MTKQKIYMTNKQMLATARQKYTARVICFLLARIDSREESYDKCELVSGKKLNANALLCMNPYIILVGLRSKPHFPFLSEGRFVDGRGERSPGVDQSSDRYFNELIQR